VDVSADLAVLLFAGFFRVMSYSCGG